MQKERGKMTIDIGSTTTCLLISIKNNENTTIGIIEMEKTSCHSQRFRWKCDHPVMQNYIKSTLKLTKEEKDDLEQPKFLERFSKVKGWKRHLNEEKSPKWMNVEIKKKQFDISNDDRPKMARVGNY
jgi:hypothetical protein